MYILIIHLNNMVIALKELKFDESEPVIYDLMYFLVYKNDIIFLIMILIHVFE